MIHNTVQSTNGGEKYLFYSSSFRTRSPEAMGAAAAAASSSSWRIFCISLTRVRTTLVIITADENSSDQSAVCGTMCDWRDESWGIWRDCLLPAVPRVQIHRILRPGPFSLHLVTIGGAELERGGSAAGVQADFLFVFFFVFFFLGNRSGWFRLHSGLGMENDEVRRGVLFLSHFF